MPRPAHFSAKLPLGAPILPESPGQAFASRGPPLPLQLSSKHRQGWFISAAVENHLAEWVTKMGNSGAKYRSDLTDMAVQRVQKKSFRPATLKDVGTISVINPATFGKCVAVFCQ